MDFKSISPRVILITIQLNKTYSLKIIQAYAPTSRYIDEEVESFYKDVFQEISENKTHYMIVIRHFNFKIGCKEDEVETFIGLYGTDSRQKKREKQNDSGIPASALPICNEQLLQKKNQNKNAQNKPRWENEK